MDEKALREVWRKASEIEGLDPDMFRKDPCGAIIMWSQYGSTTQFGWVVDHIYPLSLGGDDFIGNLRPMHWENNQSKGSDYPIYSSAVSSNGTSNIPDKKEFCINPETRKLISEYYHLEEKAND